MIYKKGRRTIIHPNTSIIQSYRFLIATPFSGGFASWPCLIMEANPHEILSIFSHHYTPGYTPIIKPHSL